jgi:hypothetical protein
MPSVLHASSNACIGISEVLIESTVPASPVSSELLLVLVFVEMTIALVHT